MKTLHGEIQDTYISCVIDRLHSIQNTEGGKIAEAGQLLSRMIEEDRLIYVFGAGGHTSLVVGELFFRIGGLANIYPISDYRLSALSNAPTFLKLEKSEEEGKRLIDLSGIGTGDTVVIFHTIGVTGACIGACKEAIRKGAYTISVSSYAWQDHTPSEAPIRNSTKENIRDFSDISIDDKNTVSDGSIYLPGISVALGPVSGIGTFCIGHLLELSTIKSCLEKGLVPPVWDNANTEEGSRNNQALFQRYSSRIPKLKEEFME